MKAKLSIALLLFLGLAIGCSDDKKDPGAAGTPDPQATDVDQFEDADLDLVKVTTMANVKYDGKDVSTKFVHELNTPGDFKTGDKTTRTANWPDGIGGVLSVSVELFQPQRIAIRGGKIQLNNSVYYWTQMRSDSDWSWKANKPGVTGGTPVYTAITEGSRVGTGTYEKPYVSNTKLTAAVLQLDDRTLMLRGSYPTRDGSATAEAVFRSSKPLVKKGGPAPAAPAPVNPPAESEKASKESEEKIQGLWRLQEVLVSPKGGEEKRTKLDTIIVRFKMDNGILKAMSLVVTDKNPNLNVTCAQPVTFDFSGVMQMAEAGPFCPAVKYSVDFAGEFIYLTGSKFKNYSPFSGEGEDETTKQLKQLAFSGVEYDFWAQFHKLNDAEFKAIVKDNEITKVDPFFQDLLK